MIHVMLVDDEPWNREIVKHFGQWDKYNMNIICEASDGAEAIEYMNQHQLQLVITDMKMPGIDGGKLMEYIRKRDPELQLIVISGYDDFEYARQALRCNAVEYLLKPIDKEALNEALAKCEAYLLQQQAVMDVSLIYAMDAYKKNLEQAIHKLQIEQLKNTLHDMASKWAKDALPAALRQQLYEELWKFNIELSDSFGFSFLGEREYANKSWHEIAEQFMLLLKQLEDQRKYKNKLNILDVRSYIEKHVTEPITLDDLACTFFVSKEYMSKQFKYELGVSVTDYIIELRMKEARQCVEGGNLSFKEIAERVGYEDVSYFYRVFRKYYGIAPGEMRKQSQV